MTAATGYAGSISHMSAYMSAHVYTFLHTCLQFVKTFIKTLTSTLEALISQGLFDGERGWAEAMRHVCCHVPYTCLWPRLYTHAVASRHTSIHVSRRVSKSKSILRNLW